MENGRTRLAFETVLVLLRHCGMDLDVMLVERDDSDWMQAQQRLRMSPGERLESGVATVRMWQRAREEMSGGAA